MIDWKDALKTNYEQLASYLVAYVPQILGALILLVVGWFIAWIFSKFTHTLVSLLGKVLNKISSALSLDKRIKIEPQHSKIISRTIFWIVLVFFVAASLSTLGVDFIAAWLRELLGYLPNVLAGAIIVIGGFVIGNIAKTMTDAALQSTDLKYSNRISILVKWMIVGIAIVIGTEQLGVNINFVTSLLIVEVAVFSLGIALAYGLGSNELVKNLVGSRQAAKHLNVGEFVQIAGFEGRIIAFTQSSLELETPTGKVFIPAKLYTETPCVVLSEIDDNKSE